MLIFTADLASLKLLTTLCAKNSQVWQQPGVWQSQQESWAFELCLLSAPWDIQLCHSARNPMTDHYAFTESRGSYRNPRQGAQLQRLHLLRKQHLTRTWTVNFHRSLEKRGWWRNGVQESRGFHRGGCSLSWASGDKGSLPRRPHPGVAPSLPAPCRVCAEMPLLPACRHQETQWPLSPSPLSETMQRGKGSPTTMALLAHPEMLTGPPVWAALPKPWKKNDWGDQEAREAEWLQQGAWHSGSAYLGSHSNLKFKAFCSSL